MVLFYNMYQVKIDDTTESKHIFSLNPIIIFSYPYVHLIERIIVVHINEYYKLRFIILLLTSFPIVFVFDILLSC